MTTSTRSRAAALAYGSQLARRSSGPRSRRPAREAERLRLPIAACALGRAACIPPSLPVTRPTPAEPPARKNRPAKRARWAHRVSAEQRREHVHPSCMCHPCRRNDATEAIAMDDVLAPPHVGAQHHEAARARRRLPLPNYAC